MTDGAIPVAWTVLPATEKHAWRSEWLRMLQQVRTAVPRRFFVIVLADRGLYARWLFQRIVRLGWHPLLRINTGGTFRPAQGARYQPLRTLALAPGTQWVGTGTAFQGPRRRLNCTLLARWDEDYHEPWLILTDLAPSAGKACWYGLRAWIEQGFKMTKRGGWQWQCTRMTDPQRAAIRLEAIVMWQCPGLSLNRRPKRTVGPKFSLSSANHQQIRALQGETDRGAALVIVGEEFLLVCRKRVSL